MHYNACKANVISCEQAIPIVAMKTEIKEGNFEFTKKLWNMARRLDKTESDKLDPGQPNLQLCLRYKNTFIQLTTE